MYLDISYGPTHIEAQRFGNAKIVSAAGRDSHRGSAAMTEEGTLYTWKNAFSLQAGETGAHARHSIPAAGRARGALPRHQEITLVYICFLRMCSYVTMTLNDI